MSLVSMRDIITNNHPDFLKLLNKIWNKAQDYSKQYGKDDARTEFFTNFSELLIWLLIQFDDFIHTQDMSSGKIKKYITLNDESKSLLVAQLDTINRSSFLTKVMFDVEHFIKSILDYFGQDVGLGYGKLTENFLIELKISDTQKMNILKLPASIRNALHNNGYTKYSINKTVLRSRTYVANKGDQINFSGWDNIYIIIDEMIDLLIDIIDKNSKINSEKNIPKKPHFIK